MCERGIRTIYRRYIRNTLDILVVLVISSLTYLPIMIDPSHGTGVCSVVPTIAKLAIAAKIDALSIEVYPNPAKALSDGYLCLTPDV